MMLLEVHIIINVVDLPNAHAICTEGVNFSCNPTVHGALTSKKDDK